MNRTSAVTTYIADSLQSRLNSRNSSQIEDLINTGETVVDRVINSDLGVSADSSSVTVFSPPVTGADEVGQSLSTLDNSVYSSSTITNSIDQTQQQFDMLRGEIRELLSAQREDLIRIIESSHASESMASSIRDWLFTHNYISLGAGVIVSLLGGYCVYRVLSNTNSQSVPAPLYRDVGSAVKVACLRWLKRNLERVD